ncbi:tyrosine-type recombinase/integrase [Candidatus Sulfurimonas baltica]|uniref:Site-specific integrase n=1 Tax=Candidatus Sulfurimonas baltica TaxID=2740404 RepID=A0A7S7LZ68_9BACT|nr:site-specific integrase [Candidatus Sulfurimonas baltica]QOY53254.1 site-specific integrase [Candidatus Sulfurimonas baltica]
MKTLPKRIPTKTIGVFFKEIISKNNKAIDKVFIIRYVDENNKERLKTIGKYSNGIREAYCKAKINEITTKIRLGEDLPHIAKQKNKLTFDDLAQRYFSDKEHTTKEAEKEKARYTNHIEKDIGHYFAENITADILLKMQNEFRAKLAPRTVNHLIFMIGTIYKHAQKMELYKGSSPTSTLDGLKLDNKRERYLELTEITELLDESLKASLEVWLFVKLGLSTGSRVGTIMNIKKKDINIKSNSITLKDFKNNKTYNGFISDDKLKEELISRVENLKANDNIIFYERTSIEYKLRPILDTLFNSELNIDDRKNRVVIHTLRHTFASHLAINGTPILAIKALMNHSSIEMTMRYAHLAPNAGYEQVRKLYKS